MKPKNKKCGAAHVFPGLKRGWSSGTPFPIPVTYACMQGLMLLIDYCFAYLH